MSPAPDKPLNPTIDHLVVVARTLAEGVAWCEATLGVVPGPGGQHALMGTHNRLLKVAGPGCPKAYFEIIAIDPDAPLPQRARWFGMDTPWVGEPGLVHFVMGCSDVAAARAACLSEGLDPGVPVAAERPTPHGPLRWCLTVPDDGALRCGGALPTWIEWPPGIHPTQTMADSPVQLRQLTLRGLPPGLAPLWGGSGVHVASPPGPALQATLDTPRGTVTLVSRTKAP